MKAKSIYSALTLVAMAACAQTPGPSAAPDDALLKVKRIYVSDLSGGPEAPGLRELIISSLNSTKLFVLTDNEERADAVLKGAAVDHSYTDMHAFREGSDVRASSTSGSRYGTSGITSGSLGVTESESHESKERKHEAYATVRLCNKDGDVLWSTTQESLGAKFRGASADVAAKIAHQISLDYERARRTEAPDVTPVSAPPPTPKK